MPIRIESLEDPRVTAYAHLTNKQLRTTARGDVSLCILETHFVVETALSAGITPISALIDDSKLTAHTELISRLESLGTAVYTMQVDSMSELVGFKVTRGVLCACTRPEPVSLDVIIHDSERYRKLVILENLTDVSNVGAIVRNAAALGADALLLAPGCADVLARRAIRTSMGTIFHLPWCKIEKDMWPNALERMRAHNIDVYALALTDEARPLAQMAEEIRGSSRRRALLFGSEGYGLSEAALAETNAQVIIPMSEGIDSLNVAASTAIASYELFK